MPIYEYQCHACGHNLEVIQKMSDDPLTLCPECNQESLKKKVSAAAFRLNGSGWYETDFKSGSSKKNLASSDNAATKKTDSTTKSDNSSTAGKTSSAPKSDSK